jgi:DNA-binding NarL/FixJ family response regulator
MARHILIVDESQMMRRVLQARILANLDDAVILEASGIEQATQVMDTDTVHLIVYSWDVQDERGLQFCKNAVVCKNGPSIPFLFLISDKKEHMAMAAELVGKAYLALPCSPEEMARAIDRVCSPIKLRQTKRYSIGDTNAIIDQRQVRIEATVLNVSAGGSLCEFELDPQFNSAFPMTLTIQFNGEEGPVIVKDLSAVVSTMLVVSRHSDQTPKQTRMGFKFINLSDQARDILAQVFTHAEDN